MLARFEGERRDFVAAIIQTSTRARTWATVNFDALYEQHQAERSRVVKALDYFQEKGWVELESKQMTEVYSLLQTDFDSQALSAELHACFTRHEQHRDRADSRHARSVRHRSLPGLSPGRVFRRRKRAAAMRALFGVSRAGGAAARTAGVAGACG